MPMLPSSLSILAFILSSRFSCPLTLKFKFRLHNEPIYFYSNIILA